MRGRLGRHDCRHGRRVFLWAAALAAIAGCGGDAADHFMKGQTYVEAKDWDAAAVELEKSVALDSTNVTALYNLAQCYTQLKDIDDAIATYHRILGMNPRHQYSLSNLGILYSGRDELAQAEAVLSRAIDLYPGWGQPCFNLATVHAKRGEWDRAFYWAKEAQRRGLDHPSVVQQIDMYRDIVQGRRPPPAYMEIRTQQRDIIRRELP